MGGCPFHSEDDEAASAVDEAGHDPAAHGAADGRGDPERATLERRAFVKSALLIGGTSALGGLASVADVTANVRAGTTARVDAAARLNRQHAWDGYEPRAGSGNTAQPPHSLVLLLDYEGSGEPSPGHRRQVETALRSVERQFDWGPSGLLFTIGYSATYFDRYEEDPPPGAAPDAPREVVRTVEGLTDLAATNDDVTADDYDAVLLVASANPANLLAVESALWGEGEEVSLDATFEGVFAKPDGWPARRVGFAGEAFQAREDEYEEEFLAEDQEVPDEAPLSMGFIAGFGESIPAEDAVTLRRNQRFPGPDVDADAVPTHLDYVGEVGERDPGVFAQGTLKHLSHLEIDLETWYGEEGAADETGSETESGGDEQRRHQMYSPYHTESATNERGGDKPGSGLTADDDSPADGPGLEESPDSDGPSVLEYADRTPETVAGDDTAATSEPTTGHSQKTARARYDVNGDGEPEQPVLRRDWDAITPQTGEDRAAGYIFNVPMRFDESIYSLLDATYNVGFTSLDGRVDHAAASDPEAVRERNGIAPYMTATRRGNWLIPPITLRALPSPRAARADLSASRVDDSYVVEVTGVPRSGGPLDPETVRFGAPETVNQAGGATPTAVTRRGRTTVFEFPAAETGLESGATVRLFGKTRGTLEPVVGTTTLE